MCSIFAFVNAKGKIFVGRNFDWIQKGGSVHFVPSYRSYGTQTQSLVIAEQMGVDRPYEGMNTSGLFIAMAAVSDDIPQADGNSLIMNDLGIMRFILERAKTVSEASIIFQKFALDYMQDCGYPKVHYLAVDKEGNASVFSENETPITQNLSQNDWLAITNAAYADNMSCPRYQVIHETLNSGNLQSEKDAFALLERVKQESMTVWSSVYNVTDGKFQLCVEQIYDYPFEYDLSFELEKGKTSFDMGALKLKLWQLQQQAG